MGFGRDSGGRGRERGGRRERGGFDRGGGFGRGGDGYDRGPREMQKAICSDCGNECEVPFKPTEGRPVYCRDCFPRHRKY